MKTRLLAVFVVVCVLVALLAWFTRPATVESVPSAPKPTVTSSEPAPTPPLPSSAPKRVAPPPPRPRPAPSGEGLPGEVPPPTPVADSAPIHDGIRAAAPLWAVCYMDAKAVDPDLVVDIRASWVIEDGLVAQAAIVEGEAPSDLEDCLLGVVDEMEFPPGTKGEVTWPFRFGP